MNDPGADLHNTFQKVKSRLLTFFGNAKRDFTKIFRFVQHAERLAKLLFRRELTLESLIFNTRLTSQIAYLRLLYRISVKRKEARKNLKKTLVIFKGRNVRKKQVREILNDFKINQENLSVDEVRLQRQFRLRMREILKMMIDLHKIISVYRYEIANHNLLTRQIINVSK